MKTLPLGVLRTRYEVKTYFRQPDTIAFTFLFPVVMLGIFSVAFQGLGNVGAAPDGSGGISQAAYYLPAMISAGILLNGVQNLAVDIAVEKSDGTLKRLGGTPLPVVAYFIGKMGRVVVTGVLQVALLLLVAWLVFGVALPTDAASWERFAWIYALGILTSAVLGIALSALPRSGASATAVVIPIMLVLQFISGVYIAFNLLPEWLRTIASFFPLKWIAQGMRSVFLPASFESHEPSGSWQLGWMVLVLLAWLIAGLIVCRLTFRWIRKDG